MSVNRQEEDVNTHLGQQRRISMKRYELVLRKPHPERQLYIKHHLSLKRQNAPLTNVTM